MATTLRPIEIIGNTFQRVGAVFVPVALLTVPSVLLAVLVSNPLFAGVGNFLYGISIAPILNGAVSILISRSLAGQTVDLTAALSMAWRKAVPLILTTLLLFIILTPATVLLVVPGLYLGVRLFATQFAVALDHKTPTEALSYSWALTKGRWWSIFGTLLVIVLAVAIPFAIVGSILGAVLPFEDVVVSNILAIAIVPPLAMAFVMVYNALKSESPR